MKEVKKSKAKKKHKKEGPILVTRPSFLPFIYLSLLPSLSLSGASPMSNDSNNNVSNSKSYAMPPLPL